MLPTPFRWMKKILAILKSNLSPNQIAFAVSLGIFAGLPPMGMHVLLPASLALLFRCSFRAFLISMGVFKLLSLALAPWAFSLGRWALDASRGLDAFWRWLFHLPILAPMGYGRYLLFGSLLLSCAIAIPTFFLVRWLVSRYRDSFTAWVRGWTISGKLRGKRGAGLAKRLLTGGEAKFETTAPPRGVFRVIRREMLIGLPVLYLLCYLIAAVVVPFFAGDLMTTTASWVVGSEVEATDTSFNLFTGQLTMAEFTIQDPETPNENLLEVPEILFDAAMLPLLSKRVVFDRISISDASLHVVREEDGTLNIDNVRSGWNADGYIEWAAEHAKDVDWLGLLRSLVDYLGQLEPLEPREDPFAEYQGGRSFPGFRPPFEVRSLEIGRIDVTLADRFDLGGILPPITLLEFEISNLAFPAELGSLPIRISLHGRFADDNDSGFELSAQFERLAGGQDHHTYAFELARVDLPRLATLYATTLPVRILSGRVTLSGSLSIVGEAASGSVSLLLEDFRCELVPGQPLFGLSASVSQRVIDGLNRYAEELPIVLGFPITGSGESPKLEWEASLLETAREGLMMLGRRELDGVIDQLGLRVDALGGVPEQVLTGDYEAVQRQAQMAAIDLIGGLAADALPFDLPETQTPSSDAAPTEVIEGLLEGLFRNLGPQDSAGE